MNKPERSELFTKAEGLFKQAKDASGNALKTAHDAGKRMWDRATDAPDENKRRQKILWLTGGGVAAVIAVLFVLSRIGGDDNIEAAAPSAQAVSAIQVETRSFEMEVSLNGEARPVRDIVAEKGLMSTADFDRRGERAAIDGNIRPRPKT